MTLNDERRRIDVMCRLRCFYMIAWLAKAAKIDIGILIKCMFSTDLDLYLYTYLLYMKKVNTLIFPVSWLNLLIANVTTTLTLCYLKYFFHVIVRQTCISFSETIVQLFLANVSNILWYRISSNKRRALFKFLCFYVWR